MASGDGSRGDRLAELSSRLEAVEERLSRLEGVEERLSRLEAGGAFRASTPDTSARSTTANDVASDGTHATELEPTAPPTPAERLVVEEPREEPLADTGPALLSASTVPLLGRTLLVLGGAFLLRAITEAGLVPEIAGTLLGLSYGILWLFFADRAGAHRERRIDAMFHGVATALIAFPLVWETTYKFHALPPLASAPALILVATVGLGVAKRRNLGIVAWITGGGAVTTAVALGFATRAMPPYLAAVLLIALGVQWVSQELRSRGLAVAVGALVHTVFGFLVLLALADAQASRNVGLPGPTLMILLSALAGVYFGHAMVRTLVRSEHIDWLDVAQLAGTFVVGIGGGLVVALAAGLPRPAVAGSVFALAAAFYVAAFGRVGRRQGRRLTFHFYATGGLVLTIVSLPLLAGQAPAAIALVALGTAGSWLGTRLSRSTASLHGSVLVLAGAITAGLAHEVVHGLVGEPGSLAQWLSPAVLVALVGTGVVAAVPRPSDPTPWSGLARFSSATVALLLALSVGALLCTIGDAVLPRGDSHLAVLATLRTGVLAVTAIAMLWVSRRRWSDLRWVSYTVLVLGAGKLVLEDLRVGHAATLFVSMALYGGALIVVSRFIIKRAAAAASDGTASNEDGKGPAPPEGDEAESHP